MAWAFARGRRVLFFPDEHLGRNTALKMGIPEEQIVVWNQRLDFGGIEDDETLIDAQVILWKGWCSTHQRFTAEQIDAGARATIPACAWWCIPECRHEVVAAADLNGSTEYIVKAIEEAPAGHDLGHRHRDQPGEPAGAGASRQTIFCLDPVVCPCSTMYRIHPAYLAWVLEELVEGRVVNQVTRGRRDGALGEGRAGAHAGEQGVIREKQTLPTSKSRALAKLALRSASE